MNFSTVKNIVIPEGNVIKIEDSLGQILWEKNSGPVIESYFIRATADNYTPVIGDEILIAFMDENVNSVGMGWHHLAGLNQTTDKWIDWITVDETSYVGLKDSDIPNTYKWIVEHEDNGAFSYAAKSDSSRRFFVPFSQIATQNNTTTVLPDETFNEYAYVTIDGSAWALNDRFNSAYIQYSPNGYSSRQTYARSNSRLCFFVKRTLQ